MTKALTDDQSETTTTWKGVVNCVLNWTDLDTVQSLIGEGWFMYVRIS